MSLSVMLEFGYTVYNTHFHLSLLVWLWIWYFLKDSFCVVPRTLHIRGSIFLSWMPFLFRMKFYSLLSQKYDPFVKRPLQSAYVTFFSRFLNKCVALIDSSSANLNSKNGDEMPALTYEYHSSWSNNGVPVMTFNLLRSLNVLWETSLPITSRN